MTGHRQVRFGLAIPPTGINRWSWRHTDGPPDASVNLAFFREIALRAEAAKIDFLFVADGLIVSRRSPPHFLNRFEPLTILSSLAAITQRIGVVGTVTTSFADPFTVARQFASLDALSGGRAGWNLVTGDVADAAENFTDARYPPHDERYAIADEHLDVVQGLWDSWEDDAFVYDRERHVFADTSKLHTLDHRGLHFRVKGPLALQRSPQGQPVIFQAGASDVGRAFAARRADAIFSVSPDIGAAKAYYADIHRLAVAAGRAPEHAPLIFPAMGAIVGGSIEEAERKYRDLLAQPTVAEAVAQLGWAFSNHDFSQYDPDAPFPDLGDVGHDAARSTSDLIKRTAREEGLTLAQTAMRFSSPQQRFVGAPETIADTIQQWVDERASDGFMLAFTSREEVADFLEQVIPVLVARGVFRANYEQDTLRGHLGRAVPINRHGD